MWKSPKASVFGDRRFCEKFGYSLFSALVTEIVMTFMFLLVIMGATDRLAPAGFGRVAIGLALR
ncbi:hypothetical protein CwatDRAFT_6692 [Crocosphaera watsonii WH 8501]|uniref:Uncharacterized protein n=1 Tax=Crocosphaera watsonii WH 8501 TaxID=165597 RepID=Q4CAU4_CROWT|nr:hypothetical protein CwatDRAFT_6692 [Crocosphaera watsonii WH 8501]